MTTSELCGLAESLPFFGNEEWLGPPSQAKAPSSSVVPGISVLVPHSCLFQRAKGRERETPGTPQSSEGLDLSPGGEGTLRLLV